MRNLPKLLGAVVLVTVFVGVSARVHGQQPTSQAQDPHHPEQGTAATPGAAMPEQRQGMMNQNMMGMMNMMNEMKAADTKLDALVQTMKAAKGAEKTDAMAALLTALVEQHRAMHGSMGMMMNMMGMMNQQGSHAEQPGTPKQ